MIGYKVCSVSQFVFSPVNLEQNWSVFDYGLLQKQNQEDCWVNRGGLGVASQTETRLVRTETVR